MNKLDNVKLFLIDMDGTVYLSGKIIEGSIQAIEKIRSNGRKICFLTNNSSLGAIDYVDKLSRMGFTVSPSEVFTSGLSTIEYLKAQGINKVFLLGTDKLRAEFDKANIKVDNSEDRAVVVGFDTALNYANLCEVCYKIENGAKYIATHSDLVCPTDKGYIPDVGAFMALIEKTIGRLPDVICGKPFDTMGDSIKRAFSITNGSEVAMVGDRLYTDMQFAINNNFVSCLVLSGETKEKQLIESGMKPDIIANNILELSRLIK